MSHKVLFAARAHIQAWISVFRSPGEDGLVRSSHQVMQGWVVGWAQAADCAASALPPSACTTLPMQMGHLMGALPSYLQSDVSLCHPLLQNCTPAPWEPEWEKLISRVAVTLQEFREAFFFFFPREVYCGLSPPPPQPSCWVLHYKSLKMWNTEDTYSFFITEHLITVALSLLCAPFPPTYKTVRSTYIWWEPTEVFSKAFSCKVALSLLTVWNLAISSTTHTRNNSTVFSKSSTAFLCDALAESHFSLMFKLCWGWLTTQNRLSVN